MLAILWFVGDDTLGFKIRHLDHPKTKRGTLSTFCFLFDPLGFAAPVALDGRRLVQDLWKTNVGWDKPLGEEFLSKWRSWKTQQPSLSQLRIPWSYLLRDSDPASCSSRSFQTHQKLGMVHHPICELSTRVIRFIVPLSWGRLGMHQ